MAALTEGCEVLRRAVEFGKCKTNATRNEWSLTSTLTSRWRELLNNFACSDTGERVRVIHQDGGTLGVQLLRFDIDRLRALEERLKVETGNMSPCHPDQLTEQSVVAVHFNSSVVRGVVSTAVMDNEVRVYLLDYGITETLCIDKVHRLPSEFVTELPLYGVRVLIDTNSSIDGSVLDVSDSNSLVDRIIHLVSLVPCSLTTARARIHVIETDPSEAKAKSEDLDEVPTPRPGSPADPGVADSVACGELPAETDLVAEECTVQTNERGDTNDEVVTDVLPSDNSLVTDEGKEPIGTEILKSEETVLTVTGQEDLTNVDKGSNAICNRVSSSGQEQDGRSSTRDSHSRRTGHRRKQRELIQTKTRRLSAEVLSQVQATVSKCVAERARPTKASQMSQMERERSGRMSRREMDFVRTRSRSRRRLSESSRQKVVTMEVPVKFLRRNGQRNAVALSLNLLGDVERALKSLKATPLQLPLRSIYWGSRVLVRRPQGLCRATVDWKEPKGVWWHCTFDDYDDPPVHVRSNELLDCPVQIRRLPKALLYVRCCDGRNIFPKPGESCKLNVFELVEMPGTISNLPINRVTGFFPGEESN